MTVTKTARFVAVLVTGASIVAACGGENDSAVGSVVTATSSASSSSTTRGDAGPATDHATTPDERGADGIRTVPAEFDTIQAAVDSAREGDLVLILPGVYHEAVDVVTDGLTIRGVDRDGVVLDGELELDNGIRVLGVEGVAIENLTAANYGANGVFFTSVSGYRVSYVTTYRTGGYGVYAYDSVNGQIDHVHAVGSRDAGVYIGQCYPCDAFVSDVLSEHNGLGYSGTNSGGNLLIVNSVFRNNRAGIVPNSGSYELCYPERETTIVGNLVYSNNQTDTPSVDDAGFRQGNGILVSGGNRNVISRNRVFDHDRTGIGLVPYLEQTPNDGLPTEEEWSRPCADQKNDTPVVTEGPLLWDSFQNEVTGNVVSDSREADLALASAGGDISTFGNCFGGNEFTTSAPLDIEQLAPCDGEGAGDWTAGDLDVIRWRGERAMLPGELDWKTAPLPALGAHDSMPGATTAPARPPIDVPIRIDLDAITVPPAPS